MSVNRVEKRPASAQKSTAKHRGQGGDMALRWSRVSPQLALTPAVAITLVAFIGAIGWTIFMSLTRSRRFPEYFFDPAEWNRQYFNQGSPKPDGSKPGITSPVTGTFDAKTRAFTLEWTSSIVGGPFNGFTGQWHLEGTYVNCGS